MPHHRSSSARPPLLKRINAGSILARILEEGAVSRAELARQVGISPPTVSALISELVEQGIITEIGPGRSARGRKPVLLELNPNGAAIAVASIMPTRYVVGISDLAANLTDLESEHYNLDDPPDVVIERIAGLIRKSAAKLKAKGRRLLGVGVSTPGILRFNDASVILSPNQPRWHGFPLGDTLRQRIDSVNTPVFIENDSKVVALAEICYGAAKGYRNVVCITVAEGVGSGVVIDGHIYSGKSGHAVELGHTIVDPDGRQCGCGRRGCLEAMASEAALLQDMRARLHRGASSSTLSAESLTVQEILSAAHHGDPVAGAAVDEVGYYLGVGMANAVNIFEPQGLVLWGKIFAHQRLFDKAYSVLCEEALATSMEGLNVWASTMGESATLKGAAALVLRRSLMVTRL